MALFCSLYILDINPEGVDMKKSEPQALRVTVAIHTRTQGSRGRNCQSLPPCFSSSAVPGTERACHKSLLAASFKAFSVPGR